MSANEHLRVLLVDDNLTALDALRRVIRLRRPAWTLTCAGSGVGAINALAADTFDVIVTDLLMPDTNGHAVLEATAALQPHARRILLTADVFTNDPPAAVAHRRLDKPCAIDELLAAIEG